jgi:hypothetical protein
LVANKSCLSSSLLHFFPDLSYLQTSSFLFHLSNLCQTSLFLQSNFDLSGFIFFPILLFHRFLAGVFTFLQSLTSQVQLFCQMFSL